MPKKLIISNKMDDSKFLSFIYVAEKKLSSS